MQQQYRIFLASSAELRNDRMAFELAISKMNKAYEDEGKYFSFRLDVWEDFNTAIAPYSKQQEYNESIHNCHIFVMLYWTKVGMYTNGEFDLAYKRFKDSRYRGPKVYVYYCTEPSPASQTADDKDSLKEFETKLLTAIGHFKDTYKDDIQLVAKFKEEVAKLFANNYIHYGTAAHTLSLTRFQAAPAYFIGRDAELADIRQRLKDGKKLMLMNADGGIGKTSLAARYWDETLYEYRHNAWLFCDTGIIPEIIKLAPALEVDIANMDEAQALEAVKRELHHREDSFLLVLDNANKPEDILAFKRHFDGFRWHVLITSRCHGVIDRTLEMHINTLPPAMAKALFTNYYSEAGNAFDELLDRLLEAIGYNTLLTEIFAKNMKELKATGETMKDYIKRLEQGHLFLGQHSFEIQSDQATARLGRAATTDEILGVLYDVNALTENEQRYMVTLAMLPATSYEVKFIATLFAPVEIIDTTKALKKLAGLGWLVNDDVTYRISPVIQHILLKKYEGNLQPFAKPLIENLNNKLKMDPYGQLATGTYADVQPYIAITDSLFANLDGYAWYAMSYLCYLLGVYYRVTGNVLRAVKYAQRHRDIAKLMLKKEPVNKNLKNNLAISQQNLGNIYEQTGEWEKALENYTAFNRLALDLYETDLTVLEYKNNLAISYQKLGDVYTQTGEWGKALENHKEYNQLKLELYKASPGVMKYKSGLAISHQKLGNIYIETGEWEKARESYKEYNKLVLELNEASPGVLQYKNSLAISYQYLGNIYAQTEEWGKALENYKKHNRLALDLYESSPDVLDYKNGLAISYLKLGDFYLQQQRNAEAKHYYQQGQQLLQEINDARPGIHLVVWNLNFVNKRLAEM